MITSRDSDSDRFGNHHFLGRLVDKVRGKAEKVEPRVPSLFEPGKEFDLAAPVAADVISDESLANVGEGVEAQLYPHLCLRRTMPGDRTARCCHATTKHSAPNCFP